MYMIAWMEVFILVIKMYILHFENIHLVNCWKSIRIIIQKEVLVILYKCF